MSTIVSKRHFFKFYVSIILGTLFFIGLATALLITYNKSAAKEFVTIKDRLMLIFSLGLYVFAGYSLYRYIRNVPRITLDKDFIKFNNQTYSLNDIDKITLTGKRPFKYVFDFPMEATTLTFKNGETQYVFDEMYSNSWQIKSFLNSVVLGKKEHIQLIHSEVDRNTVDSDFYDTFKGNPITSLRGITLWTLIGIFAYMILTNDKSYTIGPFIFVISFSAFWFVLHSYLMHYFQVSDNFLVIRNHNYCWMKKAYSIKDIKEVVFETQGKMPNCLRIITKDFKNKLYPAGTLRDKTWLALKYKLETYKIKVRNECI